MKTRKLGTMQVSAIGLGGMPMSIEGRPDRQRREHVGLLEEVGGRAADDAVGRLAEQVDRRAVGPDDHLQVQVDDDHGDRGDVDDPVELAGGETTGEALGCRLGDEA